MAKCYTCGNNYDKSFEVIFENQSYHFDCFECAIYSLAPHCKTCKCKIIGHGLEASHSKTNDYYCCAHCAQKAGVTDLKDRA